MSKRRKTAGNSTERAMMRSLDNLRLFEEFMPAINAVAKARGGADQVLKKSETLAALTLIQGMASAKDDVKVKAAIEVLNRSIGKPLERSVSLYGDINRMNERDLDNQIIMALQKGDTTELVSLALKPATPKLQGRKPRKSDPLGKAKALRAEREAPVIDVGTEARASEELKD